MEVITTHNTLFLHMSDPGCIKDLNVFTDTLPCNKMTSNTVHFVYLQSPIYTHCDSSYNKLPLISTKLKYFFYMKPENPHNTGIHVHGDKACGLLLWFAV